MINRNTKTLTYDVACGDHPSSILPQDKNNAETKEQKTVRRRLGDLLGRLKRIHRWQTEQNNQDATVKLYVIDLHNPSWGILSWSGGLNISEADYDQRLSVEFGADARILEADIVKEQPPNIGAVVAPYHYPPDTLVLKPTLLNKGDWLRLRIVVENPAHEPNSRLTNSPLYKAAFQSRILGVKGVKRSWDARRLAVYGFLIFVLGTAVGLVGSVVSALMRFALGRNVALYGIPIDPRNQDPQWAQVAPFVFNFFQGVELSILLVGVSLLSVGASKIRKQQKLLRAHRKKSSCIS